MHPPEAARTAGRMSMENFSLWQWTHHRLNAFAEAFLAAAIGSGAEVADTVHRVPAWLDAPHVGYDFVDVMGNAHCCSNTQHDRPNPASSCRFFLRCPRSQAAARRFQRASSRAHELTSLANRSRRGTMMSVSPHKPAPRRSQMRSLPASPPTRLFRRTRPAPKRS